MQRPLLLVAFVAGSCQFSLPRYDPADLAGTVVHGRWVHPEAEHSIRLPSTADYWPIVERLGHDGGQIAFNHYSSTNFGWRSLPTDVDGSRDATLERLDAVSGELLEVARKEAGPVTVHADRVIDIEGIPARLLYIDVEKGRTPFLWRGLSIGAEYNDTPALLLFERYGKLWLISNHMSWSKLEDLERHMIEHALRIDGRDPLLDEWRQLGGRSAFGAQGVDERPARSRP